MTVKKSKGMLSIALWPVFVICFVLLTIVFIYAGMMLSATQQYVDSSTRVRGGMISVLNANTCTNSRIPFNYILGIGASQGACGTGVFDEMSGETTYTNIFIDYNGNAANVQFDECINSFTGTVATPGIYDSLPSNDPEISAFQLIYDDQYCMVNGLGGAQPHSAIYLPIVNATPAQSIMYYRIYADYSD